MTKRGSNRPSTRLALLLVGLAVSLWLVPAAAGASLKIRPGSVVRPEAVLGFTRDRVVWVQGKGPEFVVRAAAPGEKPTELARGRKAPGTTDFVGDASAGYLAIQHTRYDCDRYGCDSFGPRIIEAGPLNGPLQHVVSCNDGFEINSSLDLDGSRLAYEGCDKRLHVRDLAGAAPEVTGPSLAAGVHNEIHLSGRHATVGTLQLDGSAPPRLDQYDLLSAASRTTTDIAGSALRSNGQVAGTRASDDRDKICDDALLTGSLTSPLTALPGTVCPGPLGYADDRIVAVSLATEIALVTVDSTGRQQPVASIGRTGQLEKVNDAGTFAAVSFGNCAGELDTLRIGLTAATAGQPSLRCPFKIGKRAKVKGKSAYLRVVCRRGCQAKGKLTARIGGTRRKIGELFGRDLPAKKRTQRVAIELSRRARAVLDGNGSLKARARITVPDLNDRRHKKTKSVTLVR